MSITDFQKHVGEIAETNCRVWTWPVGHQVILLSIIAMCADPLLLVESQGQKGSCHLSELEFTGKYFEV